MFIRCRVRLIHFFLTSGQQLVSQECGDCVWLISFCTLQNLSSWKHRRRRASAATYQRVEEVDSVGQEEEDKKKPKTYGEMMADRYKALPIFLMNYFFSTMVIFLKIFLNFSIWNNHNILIIIYLEVPISFSLRMFILNFGISWSVFLVHWGSKSWSLTVYWVLFLFTPRC